MKFWIGVVSREHALNGIKCGFTQVCHGKSGPLKRMKKDDWFIFYSPKLQFKGTETCKKFVGIGKVINGNVYQADMGGGFKPFRTDINFVKCGEASIIPLIEELSFIKNKKSWGFPFRFGHLEIPEKDFLLIAKAMKVNFGNSAQFSAAQSAESKEKKEVKEQKETKESHSSENNNKGEKRVEKKQESQSQPEQEEQKQNQDKVESKESPKKQRVNKSNQKEEEAVVVERPKKRVRVS